MVDWHFMKERRRESVVKSLDMLDGYGANEYDENSSRGGGVAVYKKVLLSY